MRWTLAAAELALMVRLWRSGAPLLFPGFCCYMIGAFFMLLGFAFNWYEANAVVNALITPFKIWSAIEAIRLRFVYVKDATPKHVRGESQTVLMAAILTALTFGGWGLVLPIQANADEALGRVRLTVQLGIAIALLLVVVYTWVRPIPSPSRARAHLAILACWFLAFTIADLVPIHREAWFWKAASDAEKDWERWKWTVAERGSLLAGLGCAIAWCVVFRFRHSAICATSPR
jgi:hypothetical protein